MPMIPEAVIAMLACARIGAIHSVVFGGFAAHELAARIEDAKPRVIMSASCGIEVSRVIKYKPTLDEAIKSSSHKPTTCLIWQRPQERANMLPWRDVDWESEEEEQNLLSVCLLMRLIRFMCFILLGLLGSQRVLSAVMVGILWR